MMAAPPVLTAKALLALQREVGALEIKDLRALSGRSVWDASATLVLGEQSVQVLVEEQAAVLRRQHVLLFRERLGSVPSGSLPLLVAPYISPDVAQQLHNEGFCFVDTVGNAFLKNAGIFVWIGGRPAPPADHSTPLRAGASVWQVAYVLLRDADAARLTVRALGKRAGVAYGTVSKSLQFLEQRGLVRNFGRGGQAIVEPETLLMAWLQGYADRLRATLFLCHATAPGVPSLDAWLKAAHPGLREQGALVSGDLGVQLAGTDLLASQSTVLVPRWDPEMMRTLRLLPSREGSFTVLSQFGDRNHHPGQPHVADPLLLLAELMLTADTRTRGAQDLLLQKIRARWTAQDG